MTRIWAPDYGPYSDTYRLRVVLTAKEFGFKKTAEKFGCSEASVRNWTKILAQGTLNVTLSRD